MAVLDDTNQPITLPEGDVAVAADGSILVNGAQVARRVPGHVGDARQLGGGCGVRPQRPR